jgi:AraC-like DNA-binding protein
VYRWHADRDPKTGYQRHRVSDGFGHALLAPIATFVFESLGVSASIWEHGFEWMQVHDRPSTIRTENAAGFERERARYNDAHLARAVAEARPICGEHFGFSDFFVPIVSQGKAVAVLVVGPFLTSPVTSSELLERWRALTTRQGHPSDPAFIEYLSLTLSALVLEGPWLARFERLLACIAELYANEGRADRLANEIEALHTRLLELRAFERTSKLVREMVDERTGAIWQSRVFRPNLARFGLPRAPDAILVALTRSDRAFEDAVDELIQRRRFQRRMLDHARNAGDTLAGQLGDHGVVFVSAKPGSAPRRKRHLVELSERARDLARRDFGLSLHFGASVPPRPEPLSQTYLDALAAAETALAKDLRLSFKEPGTPADRPSLRRLRRELARAVLERPALLQARFERYLESVATDSGFVVTVARGQLDAGFERIAEPLVDRGALDEKSFEAVSATLDRGARAARTLNDLFNVYRAAIADLAHALEQPVLAHRDQSLRRALEFVKAHYTEPLSSSQVAKIAGLGRTHFSKLFKQREKKTFTKYLSELRLARSMRLLRDTELAVTRVAELSGFRSAQYFSRAFHQRTGKTPGEFRGTRKKA